MVWTCNSLAHTQNIKNHNQTIKMCKWFYRIMHRKQSCCSQKQKIRNLKRRAGEKKITTVFQQLNHSKEWKYYEDTKKDQKKNEVTSTMLSWSEKKRHLLLKFCAVRKAVQSTQHFTKFFIISSSHIMNTWILNCLLEAKRISCHFIHILNTPYIIPLLLYTIFYLE